ncbi:hypothetical protein BJ912DRAFT_668300 [Pholiota molesta]|nr:hypothetical protein BJ912DRAFT_668300 [Pholiota molesta]
MDRCALSPSHASLLPSPIPAQLSAHPDQNAPLPPPPTDDAIEALILQATSARISPDGRPLRDTRTQLFVGNLPYRVRWQDLKDLFRKAGTVLRADVSLGPTTGRAATAPSSSPPRRTPAARSTCSMATRGRRASSRSASTACCPSMRWPSRRPWGPPAAPAPARAPPAIPPYACVVPRRVHVLHRGRDRVHGPIPHERPQCIQSQSFRRQSPLSLPVAGPERPVPPGGHHPARGCRAQPRRPVPRVRDRRVRHGLRRGAGAENVQRV